MVNFIRFLIVLRLLQVYKVVLSYVRQLEPFIKLDYARLMEHSSISAIGRSCVDTVAECLFNYYIQQSADNYAFINGYAKEYGCFRIRYVRSCVCVCVFVGVCVCVYPRL